jgi:hypothetical protein
VHAELRDAPVGIIPTAITTHSFDAGMGGEPADQGLSTPVMQQIQETVLLEVDQKRAVAPPLRERKVVNAEHLRRQTHQAPESERSAGVFTPRKRYAA